MPEIVTPASEAAVEEGVEIEYVDQVPHFEAEYIQFADIFEKFKVQSGFVLRLVLIAAAHCGSRGG